MDSNEYIKTRVDEQIEWYDNHSLTNQKVYKLIKTITIISAASIPFFAGYLSSDSVIINYVVGILGVVVAILTSVLSLFKFQENWIQYRTTCESLKHIKYLYLTNTHPFEDQDSFDMFVQEVESLISKENSNWAMYINMKDKKE